MPSAMDTSSDAASGSGAHESQCSELAQLGDFHCAAGDYCNGLRCYEAAVHCGTNDAALFATICSQAGAAAFRAHENEKALAYLKHELKVHRLLGDSDAEAKCCANLTSVLKALRRFDDAATFGEHQLALLRNKYDQVGESHALFGLAGVYHSKAKHIVARVASLAPVQSMFDRATSMSASSSAFTSVSSLQPFTKLYDLTMAADHSRRHGFARASTMRARTGATLESSVLESPTVKPVSYPVQIDSPVSCTSTESQSMAVRDALRRAAALYEEAYKLSETLEDCTLQGRACGNLANVAYMLGEFSRALQMHRLRHQLAVAQGDMTAQRRALCNAGNAAMLLGDMSSAIDAYRAALDLVRMSTHFSDTSKSSSLKTVSTEQQEDGAVEAKTCFLLATAYVADNQLALATAHFEEHYRLARRLYDRAAQLQSCAQLANLHSLFGNRQSALRFARFQLKLATELADEAGVVSARATLQKFGGLKSKKSQPVQLSRRTSDLDANLIAADGTLNAFRTPVFSLANKAQSSIDNPELLSYSDSASDSRTSSIVYERIAQAAPLHEETVPVHLKASISAHAISESEASGSVQTEFGSSQSLPGFDTCVVRVVSSSERQSSPHKPHPAADSYDLDVNTRDQQHAHAVADANVSIKSARSDCVKLCNQNQPTQLSRHCSSFVSSFSSSKSKANASTTCAVISPPHSNNEVKTPFSMIQPGIKDCARVEKCSSNTSLHHAINVDSGAIETGPSDELDTSKVQTTDDVNVSMQHDMDCLSTSLSRETDRLNTSIKHEAAKLNVSLRLEIERLNSSLRQSVELNQSSPTRVRSHANDYSQTPTRVLKPTLVDNLTTATSPSCLVASSASAKHLPHRDLPPEPDQNFNQRLLEGKKGNIGASQASVATKHSLVGSASVSSAHTVAGTIKRKWTRLFRKPKRLAAASNSSDNLTLSSQSIATARTCSQSNGCLGPVKQVQLHASRSTRTVCISNGISSPQLAAALDQCDMFERLDRCASLRLNDQRCDPRLLALAVQIKPNKTQIRHAVVHKRRVLMPPTLAATLVSTDQVSHCSNKPVDRDRLNAEFSLPFPFIDDSVLETQKASDIHMPTGAVTELTTQLRHSRIDEKKLASASNENCTTPSVSGQTSSHKTSSFPHAGFFKFALRKSKRRSKADSAGPLAVVGENSSANVKQPKPTVSGTAAVERESPHLKMSKRDVRS